MLAKPAPDMPDYEFTKTLVGRFATFILEVEDMEGTHKALVAKGVEFLDQPVKQDWGWWATLKDPDGNTIGLHA